MKSEREEPEHWDKLETIFIPSTPPTKRISLLTPHPVARIVLSFHRFIVAYRKRYESHNAPESCEVQIKGFEAELSHFDEIQLDYATITNHEASAVFWQALQKGKIYLFELEGNCFVDSYDFRDFGISYGPLAGHGGRQYILPSGKIFWSEQWVS